MNKKQRRMVRLIAIVLVALLVFSAIISAVISLAYAEEAIPKERDRCTLTMEYLDDEQALRISQRLVYTNPSDGFLDRVIFYMPANLLRRRSALPYEGEALLQAFPSGYLPGGTDLTAVRVDGSDAEWGFQGDSEIYLRVACNLAPGARCAFEFDYYLLLTENAAFLGLSDTAWRLSGFYFSPASLDEGGEFILNAAQGHTRYVDSPAMDFVAQIALPDIFLLAATGAEESVAQGEHLRLWSVRAENAHDFALCFGKRFREYRRETDSGVELRMLTNLRGAADRVLSLAEEAVNACESLFGALPFRQLDFVQAGCAPESLNHTSCLWLTEALLRGSEDDLAKAVRFFVAQQYFGFRAYARPASDAWLSDSVCEYLSYLLLEEVKGYDAYLAALNEGVVDALQMTIPGGLNVASDASLFSAMEYEIVVKDRGAAVFHELRTAMGRDALIAGLRLFYEKGSGGAVLTEMDLVDALDEASGKHWEKFLTDWIFNIGDYVNQNIDWLD